MRGREVKVDVRVSGEPAIVLGLVGREVVENNVKLAAGMLGHEFVHERQKLPATLSMSVCREDLAAHHVQRGEERGGPVPLVLVADAPKRRSVRQAKVALGTFESLDMGLLVDAEHESISGGFK